MARPLLPLNALRAFESAARNLNFSRAADELAVTPGAVSQQIRLLEDIVGGPLFKREAKGLQLTDLGRGAVPLLREGFERLMDASSLLREPPRRKQVSISVAPSFASKWLMPRMDDFHAAHPEIEVWISADMEPATLGEGGADLAVRYGPGDYPGHVVERLMAETVLPVAAPSLMDGKHPIRTLNFDPFSASVKLPDGRWATVEPPRSLISPWQMRLLISLLISMLILAPIVWLLARRLTQPIRVFAEAAKRLGADPDAEPLKPTGPTEVRTAIGAFNDMQASLRDHMRKRTQTIAAIAHDLRTPLTRMRFRVEQAPPRLRDRMVADVEEMDALIGQAMAFVRGETQAERSEPLDLDALARHCATGFSETGAAVTFDGGRPLSVEGDPAALRRAVANLIENAVKFADAARVRTFVLDDQAVISVEDDGPGLPEEELETVFEPFARGERSRNRETGGAGLGLSVARQAARAGGGDVSLINRPEGGLTAILVLPLKIALA